MFRKCLELCEKTGDDTELSRYRDIIEGDLKKRMEKCKVITAMKMAGVVKNQSI